MRVRPTALVLISALGAATLALGSPALGGSWVYDDHTMIGNATMDGADDLFAAFGRNSSDYIQAKATSTFALRLGGVTYRPASMISLILPHAFGAPTAWIHHAISWLLHMLAIGGLLALVSARARGATLPWRGAALIAAFALLPAGAEAYLWINGRSDVLAGAALAWLAFVIERWRARAGSGARAIHVLHAIAVGALAAIGLGAKETFLPAAVFMAAALAMDLDGAATRERLVAALRHATPVLGAVFAAAVLYFVMRAAALPADGSSPPIHTVLLDSALLERLPRVFGMAFETMALPLPRPMRTLAFELARPWRMLELVALGGGLASIAWLLYKRRWSSALLVVGALVCLVPTAHVAEIMWLGFDRYLYMPAMLIVVAGMRSLDLDEAPAEGRRLWWALVGVYLVVAAAGLWLSATYYRSETAFRWSMMLERPEDPTGYIFVAALEQEEGDSEDARLALGAAPTEYASMPMLRSIAEGYRALGEPAEVARLLEEVYRRAPESRFARFDLLGLRGAQGRFDEAIELGRSLLADPRACEPTHGLLRSWIHTGRLPPEVAARIDALTNAAPCAPKGRGGPR